MIFVTSTKIVGGTRGDASPHRELASPHRDLASPHRDLGDPPPRFERWIIRQKRPNSSPNFGEKTLQFPAKIFLFWCLFNFGDGIT